MTVKELIEQLKNCPQDAIVAILRANGIFLSITLWSEM